MLRRFSIYYLLIIFLFSLYLLGIFQFGWQKVLLQLIFAVSGAVASGIFFDYLELKKFQRPLTPFITGLIIGLVAQFGEQLPILLAIGAIAMLIKFAVKLEGRHIFNPAAGGLLAGWLFFNSTPSWWSGGANVWPFLIWIPIFLYKFKRWASMAGFLLPVLILNGINILLSSSLLFFVSVMLIEPKTSPADIKPGLIYGLTVGVGYLLLSQTTFDPLIPSLLFGNLTARVIVKYI